MAETINTPAIGVDVQPFLDALGKATQQNAQLNQAVLDGAGRITKSYADVAAAATAYSNRLAAQVADQRAASDAARSAADALRELTSRQRELQQQQKGVGSTTAEYQRLTRELDKNKLAIEKAKQAQQESTQAAREAQKAAQGITEANRQATNQIKLEAAAARDAAAAAKQQASASQDASESAGKSAGFFQNILSKAGTAFAALFAVNKVIEVGEAIKDATAQLEKYQIQLTGAFEGDRGRAERALIGVRNFADANGLEIEALTDTYVKLVNRGIIPTTTQLRQLSDIAATSGKSTDQFVEALLDAQTGEFERLKEFGIKVKNNGDTLTFTFRGVKQEVKNTQDAITQYLYALGDTQGIQGQAAAQLKSLGGASVEAKNGLTELYQVIGERSKSVFATLINGAGGAARALANYFKSSEQIARDNSAAGIDAFAAGLTRRFKAVADAAKAAGQDVDAAVAQAAADQTKFVDAKLAKARRDLATFERRNEQANRGSEVDVTDLNERARLRTAIVLYEGQREAAQRAYKASVEGARAEAEQVGRIAELRKKITAEEKQRELAPNTQAGNALRLRLNAQIEADTKELNELLGKVDKAAKAQSDKLASALRALRQERAALQSLAAKAVAKDADDAALRAKLTFDEALRQTDLLRQKLIERENAVRKAGGRGSRADGVIDGEQEKQLAALRIAALDAYYEELRKITEAREQRLFDLRADSDAKQIEAIDRKYDKLIEADRTGLERQAIEEARTREQLALKAAQEQRQITQAQQLTSSQAAFVGSSGGRGGNGLSVYEAKREEQRLILEGERKAAQDSLNNTLNKVGKEAEIERAGYAAQIKQYDQALKDLKRTGEKYDFSIAKLLLGKDDDGPTGAKRQELERALQQVAATFTNALSEINTAQQRAAADRVSTSNQLINELGTQIQAEIALRNEGSASNIAGLQKEQQEQREIRRQAIEEQRQAARAQVLVDSITQISSLVTAGAQVLEGFSAIPVVGVPLGIAAVTAMLAAFAAAKISAYNQAGNIGQGFRTGGYTGDASESQTVGHVHGKEFVSTAETTRSYRGLLEALHTGRPDKLDWSSPAMLKLLPDPSLPTQLRAEKAEASRLQIEHSFAPLQANFTAMDGRLAAIEASNEQMANQRTAIPVPGGYLIHHPATDSTHYVAVS